MAVVIREAMPTDEASWRRLWQGYTSFYECELDDAITAHTWQRILAPDAPLICFVADWDGEVVGFALCVLHEGTWTTAPICYLEDLFVDERARGHGAGKALIEALHEHGKEKGWAKVYWMTREHNRTARQLYDKLGHVDDFVRYTMPIQSR